MNRIEENTMDTSENVVEAKNEIKKALKNEKTILQRFQDKDNTLMCLMASFGIVIMLFLIDLNISRTSTM